eukprot:5502586-Prymnesium_polylepis.1
MRAPKSDCSAAAALLPSRRAFAVRPAGSPSRARGLGVRAGRPAAPALPWPVLLVQPRTQPLAHWLAVETRGV